MNRFPRLLGLLPTAGLVLLALAPDAARAAWELTGPYGKLSSRTALYLQPLDGFQTVEERFDLELDLTLQASEVVSAKFSPWFTFFAPYRVAADTAPTYSRFEAKEGWIEAAWPSWDLRVGNQVFTWARTDGFNPLDRLNPREMVDLIDAPKLPITAARINVHPESLEGWNLELAGTPLFRESRLPLRWPDSGTVGFSPEESRWLVTMPSQILAAGVLTDVEYEANDPSYPASWTAGARLTTRSLPNWDLGFTYVNGVETEPRIAATQSGGTGPGVPITVELYPSFHRYEMAGLDGAAVIGLGGGQELGFRFEAAYTWRDNSRAEEASEVLRQDLRKDDFLHAIAGLDYRAPSPMLGADWYFNLQYSFYERFGDLEIPPGADVLPTLPTAVPWDRDLILFVESNFSTLVNVGQTLIWSHRRGDGLYRPALRSEWTESFNTWLSADFFLGTEGFFGQLRENRRVIFSAQLVF